MARFFKERLAEEQFDWSVHPHGDFAEHVGSLGSLLTQCPARPDNLIPAPWVYCVETCGFTFRFRTLTELIHYRDYFSTEHLPSQRLPSSRRAKNTGDRRRTIQTPLSRLPLRLKTKARRAKVAKALGAAILYFALQDEASS